MRRLLIIAVAVFLSLSVYSQSIRKNYNEMTDLEKINLVNAFYSLRGGPDLINDLAVFHGAFFNFDGTPDSLMPDIHFNLPDEPQRDIFLAWHRRQLFEVEQAMQDINPYISIPYWNSSVDQQINSPLWANSFMGQFNTDWNLQRNLGGEMMLPMPSDVTDVQAQTQYLLYSNMLERGPVHHGAHHWVGGVMNATVSPRDPVFYLHHAWIDKLWKQWEDQNHSSSFIRTNMVRYDGTYVFNGQTLPSVNPNSIVNSRVYGVFYAENQLAILDAYTVNNTYNPNEVFFYQYTIRAQNNFVVPASRTARFESVNRIELEPGFRASAGSNFIATIGNGNSTLRTYPEIVRNQIPWDNRGVPIDWDAYRPHDKNTVAIAGNIHIFPNPFSDRIQLISHDEYSSWHVEVYDLSGRKLIDRSYGETSEVELNDLGMLKIGTYMLKITVNGNIINSSVIIKQ